MMANPMKAAVLTEVGTVPAYADFPEPAPDPGQVVIEVAATGVHHLDLAQAAGAFGAPAELPCVLGSDGVGHTPDGRRVYFDAPASPQGAWAQRTLVAEQSLLDLAEGVDDVTAAALGNTGLAAWLALLWRAELQPGESVLVLGATGAVGSIAVQVARAKGAGRVIAADRDPDRLRRAVERGAHDTVTIAPEVDLAAAFRDAAGERGFDIIIDPLWGEPAVAAMQAAALGARHIQIGHAAGADVNLPAHIVRSSRLHILGFAFMHAPVEVRREAYLTLTEYAARGELHADTLPIPLAEVADAWEQQKRGASAKLVLTP
jgi:NADPH:quinone reductase-like Zn-dependent oxidoreductase